MFSKTSLPNITIHPSPHPLTSISYTISLLKCKPINTFVVHLPTNNDPFLQSDPDHHHHKGGCRVSTTDHVLTLTKPLDN